jgi:catechol 2,3-dioxygenase-like lactoylglutathione lyase family enzyme
MPRLLYLHPTLRARDVRALAEWYRDTLGFEIRLLWGEPVSHAIVRRDEIRLGIAPRDEKFGPVGVYLFVEGVDALYAEFLAGAVTSNRAPEVTDYRMKDFDLSDPDGNRLCFGETIETVVSSA